VRPAGLLRGGAKKAPLGWMQARAGAASPACELPPDWLRSPAPLGSTDAPRTAERWAARRWREGQAAERRAGDSRRGWRSRTRLASAIGGDLIGVAIAWFAQHPEASPELRLFVITGFLGALTTFSTFSAEAVALLTRGEYGWGAAHIVLHLGCSLILTVAGIQTVHALTRT